MRCTIFLCLIFSFSIFGRSLKNTVYVISIPKSGTHLLNKLIEKLTNTEPLWIPPILTNNTLKALDNPIYCAHLIANNQNINFISTKKPKCIFIYRDPRDQVVSFAYHIKKNGGIPEADMPLDKLISLLITDNQFLQTYGGFEAHYMNNIKTIADYYALFLPWKNNLDVYTTTFEKLVGPLGGGRIQDQLYEISIIAQYLDIPISYSEIISIKETLFGDTFTFRSGKIGAWKQHFTHEHIAAFKEVAGQLLINLGYEKDLIW